METKVESFSREGLKIELISSCGWWYIYARERGACADWIKGFVFLLPPEPWSA
jgi:hypothetical protein